MSAQKTSGLGVGLALTFAEMEKLQRPQVGFLTDNLSPCAQDVDVFPSTLECPQLHNQLPWTKRGVIMCPSKIGFVFIIFGVLACGRLKFDSQSLRESSSTASHHKG